MERPALLSLTSPPLFIYLATNAAVVLVVATNAPVRYWCNIGLLANRDGVLPGYMADYPSHISDLKEVR